MFFNVRMVKLNSETDALTFQCKDILSRDVIVQPTDDDGEVMEEMDRSDKLSNRRFQILLFGSDKTGNSICLQVDSFRPYFFVRIPSFLRGVSGAKKAFLQWILTGVPAGVAEDIDILEEQHQTLFDFTNGSLALFYKIITPSQVSWRMLKDKLLSKQTSEPLPYDTKKLFGKIVVDPKLCGDDVASISTDGSKIALKIYEANIDPVLRFFHTQNISPAGWVSVNAECWKHADSNEAKTSIYAVADWDEVHAGSEAGMAPYLIASWDIECNSSHGDFPIAKKTWRKPIREMVEQNIVPASTEDLCDLIARSIDPVGKTTLDPIFLNEPKSYVGETLFYMLEGKELGNVCEKHLQSLRNCDADDPNREIHMSNLDKVLTNAFPKIAGDEIIQIGTVLYRCGAPVSKHIWVLGSVDEKTVKPPGLEVPISVMGYRDEASLLRAWFEWIGRKQPDVMIGYNLFGFDCKYVWDRLEETVNAIEIKNIVAPLSCLKTRPPRLEEKFLSSSAMGDNTMWFISSPGRLQIDLLPYIRRNHNLDSYSLDNVSATFVSGDIKSLAWSLIDPEICTIATKSTKGLSVGRFITLLDEENDRIVDKCLVTEVKPKSLTVRIEGGQEHLKEQGMPVRWAQVKDDVHPKDIFRLHRGSAQDRAIIARYCLQDCDLVMELFHKLEILNNSVAMANVCSVPVSFIFLRGQGIKIESLIFKECRAADQLIEVMPSLGFGETLDIKPLDEEEEEEDSYEGAIVLEPHTGIYIDDPITADDFASLYPSSIISENISHDTLISVKDYGMDGKFICVKEGSDKYDNLPGASYVNIEFDILRPDPGDTRKNPEKLKMGTRIARYIQKPQGTIPRILEMLLASRKKCRKQAETETDEFRKALLDAQQLAYKLTANSLYGQLGSGTFKIRRQVLAASTTAYGRKQLMYAKEVIERLYGGGADPRCDVECIYGDTDSIFLRFRPKDPMTGKRLHGKAALIAAKALTVESGKLVSSCLKPPHDFEFDKIFKSFCLLSKKRYVGDMSEDGLEDEDFHRKSMGIVMKRRDNAPIVKYVYRKAIDAILNPSGDAGSGIKEATGLVQTIARDLLNGKFPLSKLTITKSLRSEYKDPTRIAHKVLADRIGERDPGNKPSTSDRIPYVYITKKGPIPKLQGDRIELPSYIKEHGLTPDYAFYITNQIAKPVAQVFGLAVEHMPGVKAQEIESCKKARDTVEAREKLASNLLFQTILIESARKPSNMEAKGQRSIASFLKGAPCARIPLEKNEVM